MQLYRIEYDQLTKVSVFDDKNRKTEEREERVRVSMHDLPLQTAQMYRDKMEGLNFKMEAQAASRSDPQPRSHRKHRRDDTPKAQKQAAPQKSQADKVKDAAKAGDMSAAINMRNK